MTNASDRGTLSDPGHVQAPFVLQIRRDGYVLSIGGRMVARLEGGAGVLLGTAGALLREIDLEAAIERTEDWIMPASRSFHRMPLQLEDERGLLRHRFGAAAILTPQAVEDVFSQVVNDVAARRPADPEFVADLILLRELVHHGAVPQVSTGDESGPGGLRC